MSAAQRYTLRSARYVLKSSDVRTMRFASMRTRGQSCTTDILNISETGLAFRIDDFLPPEEGDMIKVEFPVPGHTSIACFATVVRADEFIDHDPAASNAGVNSESDRASGADAHTASDVPAAATSASAPKRFHIVGIQFRNLPEAHRSTLKLSLEDKTKAELPPQGFSTSLRLQDMLSFVGALLGLAGAMYWMVLPATFWFSLVRLMHLHLP